MTTESPPITRVLAAFDIPLGDVKPLTGNARVHWAQRARATGALRGMAKYRGLNKAPKATEPRRVNLTLWHGKGDRTLDLHDNLPAALKPICDGLIDAHLIVDDSPRWATFTYHQDRAKDGRRRVAVTVYAVGANG